MHITIEDDFDLYKIANCGQCFRAVQIPSSGKYAERGSDPLYRFITGNHILYIRSAEPGSDAGHLSPVYEVSCTKAQWESVWVPYFDLNRNYAQVRNRIPAEDSYLLEAAEKGRGIRILRQDPWETLVTFIISQRKNIPAIRKAVEQIAALYGSTATTPYERLCLFPTAMQIMEQGLDKLAGCSLGYRLPYVIDAIECVADGRLDLGGCMDSYDQDLFGKLQMVKGVGCKISNCVCLFAYGRTSLAPVDVWIDRVIREHYQGKNPFPAYGHDAGIMQQYMFYAAQTSRDKS